MKKCHLCEKTIGSETINCKLDMSCSDLTVSYEYCGVDCLSKHVKSIAGLWKVHNKVVNAIMGDFDEILSSMVEDEEDEKNGKEKKS